MKTSKIDAMSRAGVILGEVLEEVMEFIKPGVLEIEIDALAEKLIRKKGGEAGFKKVPGYHHTICVSTNDVVVHGIPTDRVISEGDVVGVDCGVYLDGYHTDMAETKLVLDQRSKIKDLRSKQKFLEIGKRAMFAGIKAAKPGNRVGDISKSIQEIVEGSGYSVVRSLVGHGVGKKLHESPEIPGYLHEPIEKTPKLNEGMTIAVEVIYNMGNSDVVYTQDDDWTIVSEDSSLSGLFERTILIDKTGPRLLTKLSGDKL